MKTYAHILMRRNQSYIMTSDIKLTSDEKNVVVECPLEYVRHQSQIQRIVITIPGKCIGRTKVTHEILLRFNWSRVSLVMTVIALLMASVTLVILLLN